MTTVLQYLVIAAVIGLILFGVALLLFGRGERLSALPARTSPAQLPERGIDGGDVRRVRFALALRGYRMSDVDWTLERLADELDRTRAEVARLSPDVGSTGDPGSASAESAGTVAAGPVRDDGSGTDAGFAVGAEPVRDEGNGTTTATAVDPEPGTPTGPVTTAATEPGTSTGPRTSAATQPGAPGAPVTTAATHFGPPGVPTPSSTHPSIDHDEGVRFADHQAGRPAERRDPDAAPPPRPVPQPTPGTEA